MRLEVLRVVRMTLFFWVSTPNPHGVKSQTNNIA
jgi:hypothetical protein